MTYRIQPILLFKKYSRVELQEKLEKVKNTFTVYRFDLEYAILLYQCFQIEKSEI